MKVRYLIAALTLIHILFIYALNVNLNIAIVRMINYTAIEAKGEIHNPKEDGPFIWKPGTQGLILSSYYWGYALTQLPGGRLAEMSSAKWVLFSALLLNIFGTLLTPICAKWNYRALIGIRLLEGFGAGAVFPSAQVLLAYWAPPVERSLMTSIMFSGSGFGSVTSTLCSGLIADFLNWEAVFYIEGIIAMIWLLIWVKFIADTPNQSKYISEEETEFINNSLRRRSTNDLTIGLKKHYKVPWGKVFRSPPFLAILIAHISGGWTWFTLSIETPQYMKTVLYYDIKSNAILSAIPFLGRAIFGILYASCSRQVREKNWISSTSARKCGTLTGSGASICCLTVLCFIRNNYAVAAVIMIFIAMSGTGAYTSGHTGNHVDIAPNFAGTLMGLTNTAASCAGIISPIFCGYLLDEHTSIESWRIIFGTTILFSVISLIVYLTFASGEVQFWNEPPNTMSNTTPSL